MGYTHYWRRKESYPIGKMEAAVKDFEKVLPIIEKAGVILAGGRGDGEPQINPENVIFNGKTKCGHPQDKSIMIPWPSKTAGGVAKPYVDIHDGKQWFAGAEIETRICDGSCDYETFHFPRVTQMPDYQKKDPSMKGLMFEFCKTAFRPYDLAVITFLVIAKHHFGNDLEVSSDGTIEQWFDGRMLCQQELGYGLDDFKLEGDEE